MDCLIFVLIVSNFIVCSDDGDDEDDVEMMMVGV